MSAEVLEALAGLQAKVAEFVAGHEEQARAIAAISGLKEWSAEISLALDHVEATQRDLRERLERLETLGS